MKSRQIITLFFLFFTLLSFSQNFNRIEVKGQIIVDHPDLEGVTVFNTSSNEGTITDASGKFKIKVALNDVVEVSALQFEKFVVTVSKEIIQAKSMTIFLVERVNRLDEVLILPYGLSGNLGTDVASTKMENPNLDALYFGLDNLDKIEFQKDYITKVNAATVDATEYHYGVDFVKALGTLLKPVFNFKGKQKEKNKIKNQSLIASKYSTEYLLKRLSIPKDRIVEFIDYVESKGVDTALLETGREFEFLNFLIEKSKEFQSLETSKN